MTRKCKRCGTELTNNYYKWCDSCLMAKWESAKGQEKSTLFRLLEMRGFKVEYKKRCSCGSFLDNNNQKKCTDCLLDEMCELVKSGKQRIESSVFTIYSADVVITMRKLTRLLRRS